MAVFNVVAPVGFSYWNYFGDFTNPGNFFTLNPTVLATHTGSTFTLRTGAGGPNIIVTGNSLVYDSDHNVIDGNITSMQIRMGGTALVNYTGLTFDAGDFYSMVQSSVARQEDFFFLQMFASPAVNITGSAGNDDLRSGNGNDTINLGGGDDYIEIGGGTDSINGGDGWDNISYHWNGGFHGINITINTDPVTGVVTGTIIDQFGATDTIANVEQIEGTFFNDRTAGTSGADDYFSSLGEGRDRYNGGGTTDFDYVDYGSERGSHGIVVNLLTGTVIDTFGFKDILTSIEEIGGTQFDDSFIGNADDNWFDVGDGADTADGGASKSDVVSYGGANTGTGIVADLNGTIGDPMGTIQDPWGNIDRVLNIEDINGSQNDDQMTGDTNNNRFRGNEGADTYDGGDGFDRVLYHGENGLNGIVIDLSGATVSTDTFGNIESLTDIEGIRGSKRADSIIGSIEDNWFQSLAGNDTIRGGKGSDVVNYANDDFRGGHGAVNVNLGAVSPQATDGFGDTDTLGSIENVYGTIYGDTIIGSSVANRLSGQEGNDTLTGGAEADKFVIEDGHLGAGNVDTITDYVLADTIQLAQAMFTQIAAGTLATTAFKKGGGADPLAGTADHRIIYSSLNGNIWYDPDGNGVATKVLIATLTGSPDGLTAADFDIFV